MTHELYIVGDVFEQDFSILSWDWFLFIIQEPLVKQNGYPHKHTVVLLCIHRMYGSLHTHKSMLK